VLQKSSDFFKRYALTATIGNSFLNRLAKDYVDLKITPDWVRLACI
jgi:hypothetical protein